MHSTLNRQRGPLRRGLVGPIRSLLRGSLAEASQFTLNRCVETTLGPASVCSSFGIDYLRIRETLAALRLRDEHGGLAERIRTEVIGQGAGQVVDACLDALAGLTESALLRTGPDARAYRHAWCDRLQRFGAGFDTPAYFAEHLSLPATPAQAGFSLRLLQMQHHVTQQVLLERLEERFRHDPGAARALASCLRKLTALNLLLATEGFHRRETDGLRGALADLRAEATRLYRSAATDELTGAMSFSHTMYALDRQVGKSAESGRPLCVLMADLDFFKKVNDTYGHLVGDIVLKHTAERIRSAMRDFDIVGRFGGEEFVILMANTDLELGKAIAERIRQSIAQAPFHVKKHTIDVTISIGVALLKPGETRDAVLERADAAMYAAKMAGRNRVMVVGDS